MEQLIIGIVQSPHGLAGTFKVKSTSGESAHFANLDEVTLRQNGTEKKFTIEFVEGCTANLLMKCVGIDLPEEVKKYSGWEIVVPRDKACPLHKDEFYTTDLVQCKVIFGLADGAPIEVGSVTGVQEGGGGYLLEISLSESFNLSQYINDEKTPAGSSTRFVPFRSEFIGTVDIKRKTVELMHLWILE